MTGFPTWPWMRTILILIGALPWLPGFGIWHLIPLSRRLFSSPLLPPSLPTFLPFALPNGVSGKKRLPYTDFGNNVLERRLTRRGEMGVALVEFGVAFLICIWCWWISPWLQFYWFLAYHSLLQGCTAFWHYFLRLKIKVAMKSLYGNGILYCCGTGEWLERMTIMTFPPATTFYHSRNGFVCSPRDITRFLRPKISGPTTFPPADLVLFSCPSSQSHLDTTCDVTLDSVSSSHSLNISIQSACDNSI